MMKLGNFRLVLPAYQDGQFERIVSCLVSAKVHQHRLSNLVRTDY